MKIVRLILLLFCLNLNAQANDVAVAVEKDHFKLFVGAGASFNNGFEINSYLAKNNIQTINPVQINANAGVIYYCDDVDIDLGYELFASGDSNEKTKNRFISNGIKLRSHYVFQIIKNFEIGTGFNISYAKRKLAIYYTDYTLDFNNLPAGVNGNQISLFNEKAYIGPSFCLKIKEVGRRHQQTKITFSYELPINNKPWESSFLQFENKIFEKNRNQFIINVSFML
jgi:hypothetical protein